MSDQRFVILLYHGVTTANHRGIENCSRKHIPAREFAGQMEYLAGTHTVLSMSSLLRAQREGGIPSRAVAVTFDDGFQNNYTAAFPILQRYGIPATFYLSTGLIGTGEVFWVDKLEYLLNETPLKSLELMTMEKAYRLQTAAERAAALQDIKVDLKTKPGRLQEVLGELESVAKTPCRYDYEDYQTLTWDQVRVMRQSGLCEFGAHTVDHAILSHLSTEGKRYQIRYSKRQLEAELQEPVELFSYTEGLAHHYDDETIAILRAEGFSSSPTAIFGVNSRDTSPFHLHRNMVAMTAPFEQCVEVPFAPCR